MLFRGDDGLDELTTTGPSTVYDVRDGVATATTLDPAELGFARASVDDLQGGDAATSAELVRALLAGEQGPRRDVVLLNAGAVLEIAGRAPSLADGVAPRGRRRSTPARRRRRSSAGSARAAPGSISAR